MLMVVVGAQLLLLHTRASSYTLPESFCVSRPIAGLLQPASGCAMRTAQLGKNGAITAAVHGIVYMSKHKQCISTVRCCYTRSYL
jgi:hypothetical protein